MPMSFREGETCPASGMKVRYYANGQVFERGSQSVMGA